MLHSKPLESYGSSKNHIKLFLIKLMKLRRNNRIIFLIGKQGISYQRTQETAANIETLKNPRNFLAIVLQVKHRYLLLYEHNRSTLRKDL